MQSCRLRKCIFPLRASVVPYLCFTQLRHSTSESSGVPSEGSDGSASSISHAADHGRRRRSKRVNFADFDRILGEENERNSVTPPLHSRRMPSGEGHQGERQAQDSPCKHRSDYSSCAGVPGSSDPPPRASISWENDGNNNPYARAYGVYSPQRRQRRAVFRGGSAPFRWLRALWEFRQAGALRLLRTPGLGRLVMGFLTASAYTAYLGGKVTFYIRRSQASPGRKGFANGAAIASPFSRGGLGFPSVVSEVGGRVHRGLLQGCVREGIFLGPSPIHGRGLFTAVPLRRGTCVLTVPQRALLTAPSFLRFLADTPQRLPETWHYTHPTGALLELVLRPLPHHLLNHSCDANVVVGLSVGFWPAAAAAGQLDRLRDWEGFANANSFFVARDLAAGEELTLDYGRRVAPLFYGDALLYGRATLPCRCGTTHCRHFVYTRPGPLEAYCRRPAKDCFTVARDLLALGVDDEAVLLSLLPSTRPLWAYLHGEPTPELLPASTDSVTVDNNAFFQQIVDAARGGWGLEIEKRREKKSELMLCYRHVFKMLNEADPTGQGRA